MPDPSDELTRRLRAEADRLDAAAPPIVPAAARSTSPAAPTTRRWLPAAAAIVVLAGIGAAWLVASGDDDPEELIIPADPPSTTTTTPPSSTTAPSTSLDFSTFPAIGIALQAGDGPIRALDLDGDELFTIEPSGLPLNGPSIDMPTASQPDPMDPADVPEDCESAFAGGTVRVALCAGQPQQPTQIDLVDIAGTRRRLSGVPFDDTAPSGVRAGHWRWALPSPDGRWVLAQWSGECEVPEAFLTPTEGEGVPLHLDPVPAWTTSRGLGWTPEGRAIVELGHGACGTTAEVPGVYLLDPDTRELSLVVELTDGELAYVWQHAPPANVPERMLARALEELGLDGCCGEPSHGGPSATSGAVYEGADIGITGAPVRPAAEVAARDRALELETGQEIQRMPLLHGEAAVVPFADGPLPGPAVRLDCGGYTWTLTWWDEGTPEVDSMLLLAEALVPHLYCTLPPSD